MEGSKLGGKRKVPMLGGQWKEKEKNKKKHIFTFSHFPQQILLKPSFFSINFKVLLYHGFRSLLTHFLPFSLTYKL
jgi:hypothetical protein